MKEDYSDFENFCFRSTNSTVIASSSPANTRFGLFSRRSDPSSVINISPLTANSTGDASSNRTPADSNAINASSINSVLNAPSDEIRDPYRQTGRSPF